MLPTRKTAALTNFTSNYFEHSILVATHCRAKHSSCSRLCFCCKSHSSCRANTRYFRSTTRSHNHALRRGNAAPVCSLFFNGCCASQPSLYCLSRSQLEQFCPGGIPAPSSALHLPERKLIADSPSPVGKPSNSELRTTNSKPCFSPCRSVRRIRQRIRQNRHDRRILVQMLLVDLVECVRRRMVIVEIETAVLHRGKTRHTLLGHPGNIFACLRRVLERSRPVRIQHRRHRPQPPGQFRLAGIKNSCRMVRAEIAFNCAHMVSHLRGVLRHVRRRAL